MLLGLAGLSNIVTQAWSLQWIFSARLAWTSAGSEKKKTQQLECCLTLLGWLQEFLAKSEPARIHDLSKPQFYWKSTLYISYFVEELSTKVYIVAILS